MARKKSRPGRRIVVTPSRSRRDADDAAAAAISAAAATDLDDSSDRGGGEGGGIVASLLSNLLPASSSSPAAPEASPSPSASAIAASPSSSGGDVVDLDNDDRMAADDADADADCGAWDDDDGTATTSHRRRVRLEVIPPAEETELGESGSQEGRRRMISRGEDYATTTSTLNLTLMLGDDGCDGGAGEGGGYEDDRGDEIGGEEPMMKGASSSSGGRCVDQGVADHPSSAPRAPAPTIGRSVLRSTTATSSSSSPASASSSPSQVVGGGDDGGHRLRLSVSLDGGGGDDDPSTVVGCGDNRPAPTGMERVLTDERDVEDVLATCLMMNDRHEEGDDHDPDEDVDIIDEANDGEGEGEDAATSVREGPALLARWRERAGPLVDAVLEGLVSLSVRLLSPSSTDTGVQKQITTRSGSSEREIPLDVDVDVDVDAVEVTLRLTPLAFDMCSPPTTTGTVGGGRPSAPLPLRTNHLSRQRHPAVILRSALGVLFPETVIADVARDPNPTCRKRADDGGGNDDVITAKMIYDVIDDAHSSEWCCSPGDGTHERHGCLGRGGGGGGGGDDVDGDVDDGGGEGVGEGWGRPREEERSDESRSRGRRLDVEGLRPTLRPYQEAAVRWMLSRETEGGVVARSASASVDSSMKVVDCSAGGDGEDRDDDRDGDSCWELAWVVLVDTVLDRSSTGGRPDDTSGCRPPIAGNIVPLHQWRREAGGGDGKLRGGDDDGEGDGSVAPLFYNPFTGWLCRSVEDARRATTLGHVAPSKNGGAGSGAASSTRVRGGILADSMGTGKTVEVLACILSNRCPDATDVGGDGIFGGVTDADHRGTGTNDDEVKMMEGVVEEEGAAATTIGTNVGASDTRPAEGSVTVVSASGSGGSSSSSSSSSLSSSASSSSSSSSGGGGDGDDGDDDVSAAQSEEDGHRPGGVDEEGGATKIDGADDDDADRRSDQLHQTAAARSVTTSEKREDEEDEDDGFSDCDGGACICGRDHVFRGCLGWVLCGGCGERMHGLCAGFGSRAEVERSCIRVVVDGDGPPSSPPRMWCSAERCPCCVASASLSGGGGGGGGGGPTIKSRATLIVTPPSILEQWRREIRRHTTTNTTTMTTTATARHGDGLKVVIYPGMKELCGNASSRGSKKMDVSLIHPKRLADADVVLTTFQTLMGDLGHSGDNPCLATNGHNGGDQQEQHQRRRLRKRKRFRVVPSPLTCIKWWRVCLDEAQRVEAPTAASARMALLLPACNRWCVTGTPVGRGRLDDLYGLLLFLGGVPFRDKAWFRHCLHGAHRGATDRLSHLLRDVLWRSTKANDCVRLQMGIPRQEERRVVLKFSSVERHFYQRQLEETILAVSSMQQHSAEKSSRRFPSARKKDTTALSMQLHRLRAACCHPQVGSGGLGRAFGANRSTRGGGVSSGVLTMDQILDRLIDDAKTKCEESLRLAVLHSNALASLTRLRVEARGRRNVRREGGEDEGDASASGEKSDRALLLESGGIYMDSLSLMNSNATPCEVAGEAVLSGCAGFLDPRKVVRDGMALLRWQLKCWDELGIVKGGDTSYARTSGASSRQVWARIDFEGPAKKLISFRVRQHRSLPEDFDGDSWRLLLPRRCVLQCSNASVGGEFVDVRSFEVTFSEGGCDDWLDFDGFRTNKSKSWRIVVNDYHEDPTTPSPTCMHRFVALEVQFFEPNIAADDLQRQHVMHNATIVFSAALQQRKGSMRDEDGGECAAGGPAAAELNGVEEKLAWMQTESEKLDILYMGTARVVHRESKRQLQRATESRAALESELESLRNTSNDGRDISCGKDPWLWWSDLLTLCHIHGTEDQNAALCEAVQRDVAAFLEQFENSELNTTENRERYSFPAFSDEDGLFAALSVRMQSIGVGESRLEMRGLTSVQAVAALSENPSDRDVIENGNCRKCRDYFFRTGPKCLHCKLEECLISDEAKLLVEESSLMSALKALAKWLADNRNMFKGCHYTYLAFLERSANKFFEVHASYKKEMVLAKRAWRAHFDLLSDLDELSQSKSSMRLLRDGEDLNSVQPNELDTVVPLGGIDAMCMDHDSKQAMALSTLRRNKDTLRYLRNQSMRRKKEVRNRSSSSQAQVTKRSSGEVQEGEKQTCVVCLCDLAGEHAVLACGHCFHYSPCLEKLAKGGGSATTIACPMRCILRTRKDEIFIASDKRRDDGSRISRSIEGCWGTKVEMLVSDVMDVIEMGEKSLIFSQWDDMLAIVEEAFSVNGIRYVRPKGQKSMGCSILKFRNGTEHPVLLMNVKSGAEGLTLVEATHVFMVEPLLNCGLDQQAINRVHRIGQTCKTFVHRYIIENTIEGKIDELRVERQGSHNESESTFKTLSRDSIPAGGIDGGFSREELHRILH